MNPITSFAKALVSPVFNIADKLVMDKDKYAELQFKKTELKEKRLMKTLTITTTPSMDAFVKMLVAIHDLVIPMFRPVGSFALAAFAAYCQVNEIQLPAEIQILLYGSPVGWGVSRHVNKQTEAKVKASRNPVTEEDFE